MQRFESKKEWQLTPIAWDQLLQWLDEGTSSEGARYLEMRRRLVAYFERKQCFNPDELADETLNRVAHRLTEESIVTDTPAHYCYIVARFVFMEYLRERRKVSVPPEDLRHQPQSFGHFESGDTQDNKEKMLHCLEQCTVKLEPPNRDIIIRYYAGKQRIKIENRRTLAQSLGITMNALSIRACRIRGKLEGCVKECLAAK